MSEAKVPDDAAEGDWLRLGLTADPERTGSRRGTIEDRMARILRTRGGGRFG